MYYVYILKCRDNTLYTGYTKNIKDRVQTHNSGKGAKYTRGRLPVELKYFEEFEDKGEALKREHEIKKLSREDKILLIQEGKS